MESYIRQIDSTLNNALNTFHKNTLIKGALHLLLILYAARLAPSLPKEVLVLFENPYVKLFVFSMVLWTAQFSPSTSILIALSFLVTLNYVNKKPLWEFLENVEVDPTIAPVAPTKDVAIDSAAAVVQSQTENAPIVDGVAQKDNTVVIQPTIVQTPNGQAVVNPSVVIAPAVVSNSDGEKIVVKPSVTVLEAPSQQTPPQIVQQAPSPSLVDLASAPAPAPTPAPSKQQQSEPAGCYPVRRYDMDKVNAYESSSNYGQI